MCGRVTLTVVSYDKLCEALGVEGDAMHAAMYRPRYNVAPTDPHWIVRASEEDKLKILEPARWGLLNFWAKDDKRAAAQINARVESVATTRAYREAYEKRRCLVPVDGWLEWFGSMKDRRPVRFHRADNGLTLIAGIFEDWRDPKKDGEKRRTYSILTTEAKGLMANYHDRMPVRVPARYQAAWLAGEMPAEKIILEPMDDETVVGDEVSKRINSVKNDDPSVLELAPKIEPGTTGSLF